MPMPVAVEASMSHMAISYGLPAVPSPPITPFAGVKSESLLMRIELWDGHCEGLGNTGDPEARIGTEVRATRAIRPTMTRVIRPWVATSPSTNAMGVTTYHLSGRWTTRSSRTSHMTVTAAARYAIVRSAASIRLESLGGYEASRHTRSHPSRRRSRHHSPTPTSAIPGAMRADPTLMNSSTIPATRYDTRTPCSAFSDPVPSATTRT